jgi:hypothetical protein
MKPLPIVRLSIAAFCCGATTVAEAQWTRHQGVECRPSTGTQQASHANTGFGATNISATSRITLACRSDDTSAYPDSAVNEVRLYVRDASPLHGITVQACVTRRNESGSQCSASYGTSTVFVGDAEITIPAAGLALWKDSIDFSYLRVVLPPKYGNSFSYLKGWVTEQ